MKVTTTTTTTMTRMTTTRMTSKAATAIKKLFGHKLSSLVVIITLSMASINAKSLSRREREILTKDLGSSRLKLFVGSIPEVDDVGVFRPVRIPTKFSEYDVSPKDGFITLMELTDATDAVEGARSVFKDIDKNHDGRISVLEFMRAPWNLRPKRITPREKEDPSGDVVYN